VKDDLTAAPGEAVCGFVTRQHDRKRLGHLLQFPFDRPYGEVAQRIPRLTPARKLDVNLVSGIRSDIASGVVEKAQHDVVIQAVDSADRLELVPAEAQPLLHGDLGARPFALTVRDPQVQVRGRIQPDVVWLPNIGPGSATA